MAHMHGVKGGTRERKTVGCTLVPFTVIVLNDSLGFSVADEV